LALSALHLRSDEADQVDRPAVRGNRIAVDHPNLVGFEGVCSDLLRYRKRDR
jgi:hypothetical protein